METIVIENIAFRCRTNEIDLTFITDAININPTRIRIKGEALSLRNPESQKLQSSLWVLEWDGVDKEVIKDRYFAFMKHMLARKSTFEAIRSRLISVDFYFGLYAKGSQFGGQLPQNIIQDLSLLGVDIEFNFFCDSTPSVEQLDEDNESPKIR